MASASSTREVQGQLKRMLESSDVQGLRQLIRENGWDTPEMINQSNLVKDQKGRGATLLQHACAKSNLTVVRMLCDEFGADVNKRYKKTPLMCAASWGKLDIVKYLCEEKRVDVMAKDNYHKTAADYARDHKVSRVERYLKKIQKQGVPSAPSAPRVETFQPNQEPPDPSPEIDEPITDEELINQLQQQIAHLTSENEYLKSRVDELERNEVAEEKERDIATEFANRSSIIVSRLGSERWQGLHQSKLYRWYLRLKNRTEYYTEKEKQVEKIISRFNPRDSYHLKKWHEQCKTEEKQLFDSTLNSFHEIQKLIESYAQVTNELQIKWADHLQLEHDGIYREFKEQIEGKDDDENISDVIPIAKRKDWVYNSTDFSLEAIKSLNRGEGDSVIAFNNWLTERRSQFTGLVTVEDGPVQCNVKKIPRVFFKTFYTLNDEADIDDFVQHPFKDLTDFLRWKFVFEDWRSLYNAMMNIEQHPMKQEGKGGIAYYRNDFSKDSGRIGGFKSILLLVKIPLYDVSYMVGEVQLAHHILDSYVKETHRTYEFVRYFKFGRENLVQSVLDEEVDHFFDNTPNSPDPSHQQNPFETLEAEGEGEGAGEI